MRSTARVFIASEANMYVQTSPHFLATLVVTITGNTYGCVRTPTRVGLPSTDDDSTYTPLPHDHRKSAGPVAGPPARSDARMTAARRISRARASSTRGRPVASLYPASTRSIHEVRESDASFFSCFFYARVRVHRARERDVARRSRDGADGWLG